MAPIHGPFRNFWHTTTGKQQRMNWSAHVTVATLVAREGRFLLVEETGLEGEVVFNQPAGHVEAHETLATAAVRETLEETGWDVELTGFLGVYTYTPPRHPDITYFRMAYLARPLQHHPERALDEGIIAARWLTLDELRATGQARSPLVLRCIEDALAGRCFPLDVVYDPAFVPVTGQGE